MGHSLFGWLEFVCCTLDPVGSHLREQGPNDYFTVIDLDNTEKGLGSLSYLPAVNFFLQQ
jgi:hypothetical protein